MSSYSWRYLGGILFTLYAAVVMQHNAAAQKAESAILNVHVSERGARISPTLFGAFFEEINQTGEGGIYGELVRNRAFNAEPVPAGSIAAGWQLIKDETAIGDIALDLSQPLNDKLKHSLRVHITSVTRGQRIGVSNQGYWGGIPLNPDASYQVSLYAKSAGSPDTVIVSLESSSGKVLAQTKFEGITSQWQKFSAILAVSGLSKRTSTNRLVVAATAPGTVWLNLISLFPTITWHNRPNGLRRDLMDMVSDLQPKLMRIPGGNYIEGNNLDGRWQPMQTIGDVSQRPGHNGPWGYFSSDGLGFHEYLQMAEDLGAKPILGLFAGYTLSGHTETTCSGNAQEVQKELGPYLNEALNAIEYAVGGKDTFWGKERAENGHPSPFNLEYVEIGNEDFFDHSGSYDACRFKSFYDLIKANYPSMQVIATDNVFNRKPDIVDEHFYPDTPTLHVWEPEYHEQAITLLDLSHRYDSYNRSGPKIFVGEYAAKDWKLDFNASPSNLGAAIGEAAFMTGFERNSDIVMGSAYAPLFANASTIRNWAPDLIWFDRENVYGSPSYYVQQLFSTHTGDVVIPTDTGNDDGTLFTAASLLERNGTIFLKVVNTGNTAKATSVVLRGLKSADSTARAIVLTSGSPSDENSFENPANVVPITSTISDVRPTFTYTFAANSVTVLSLTHVADNSALVSFKPMTIYQRHTFRATTDPARFIRHRNGLGYVERINNDRDKMDATFIVVPGLDATIDGCISFESLNFRDHYLRHLNFRIQLDQDDTPLFKTDATFCPRAGLSGHGISFEALNFPGQFVHVRRINSDAFELWVDKPQGDLTLFNKDSSFAVTASWAPLVITNVRHSFQAVQMQFQERFIRHRNPVAGGQRLASLDPINSTSTDMEKETATFMIAPALDSTTDDCISFESVDIPGSYLRHFNFRLQLDRNDGSPLFQSDATFCPREGLAGEGVSFESVNFPRRYIRHFNFELWLQHSDGSSQFHKDASFNVSVPWAGER